MEVVWNSRAADKFFEQIVEPLEWMTIFFEQITVAVRMDDNFFQRDRLSRSNDYQIFGKSFSQLSVISCSTKFAEFVFAARNASRLAMGL